MPPVVLRQKTISLRASETDDYALTTGREALWLLVYPSQVANSLPSMMQGIHGLMAQGGDETFIGTRMSYQGRTMGHFVTSGSSPRSSWDQRSLAKLESEWLI
jgi:hypothetical protein